jgi:hypothetical protein
MYQERKKTVAPWLSAFSVVKILARLIAGDAKRKTEGVANTTPDRPIDR